ncbi:HDOD domain-containing protein [Roseateles violae]|uniref:HDOD domain-containing protein n=1 Tax=Roseateles violae TaxID=3058042 RepID=A0ABT8DZ13_9BURK|nr:HDOD domain-containing protein [Pelomonas sp. PFR6]MDN3922836.1 HDOD domain-containing protein [Pelomonas sp. PFR6]
MNSQEIRQEVDKSRSSGGLKQIVIPPCPEALIQLQQALAHEQPDLNVIQRIAAADVAMSATLLRTANSPLFKPIGKPCTTVGQAMTRIGLQATLAVMMGFLVSNAIRVNHPQLHRFWQRSTKRAMACAFVAAQLPDLPAGLAPGLAHTFGLFLHVGMAVLMQSVPGYGGTLVEAGARIDRPFIATENANHRTDHAVVGALVMRVWNMPPELMAGIRLHHDFAVLGGTSVEPLVQGLIAAGHVAEHLMRRHEGLPADADWIAHRAAALAWLRIDEARLAEWDEPLRPVLDAA